MARALPRPPKEVDLHAAAFLKNVDRYEADELLAESLELLRESLDAAIYWDYTEIRFVHGKGKGILRQAVYEELAYYKQSGAIDRYHPSYQNEDVVVVSIGL
ncbi:Smr/MutS family protein [Sphingobacterium oryzagri]|uniref:Smr/MutS family protein n=1 Tax=Sphingobacterium oryzagri TaxID=3025669 RepID=A0ABY7WJB5_9SPHI|nr:Smr/MutS family protein [Sphingobacterium sp. KACC 22765]WDF69696.1 Smr/MutS family protein [Sphingobacterium sp. KACC 22765]